VPNDLGLCETHFKVKQFVSFRTWIADGFATELQPKYERSKDEDKSRNPIRPRRVYHKMCDRPASDAISWFPRTQSAPIDLAMATHSQDLGPLFTRSPTKITLEPAGPALSYGHRVRTRKDLLSGSPFQERQRARLRPLFVMLELVHDRKERARHTTTDAGSCCDAGDVTLNHSALAYPPHFADRF
jgi:hypothetical protein